MTDPFEIFHAFLWSHRYAEAAAECRRLLTLNSNDIGAMDGLASALTAAGQYREALPLLERVGQNHRESRMTPGHPGRQEQISCLHWLLGESRTAIELMRGLVEGILDRSINYGDAAGGVTQGLLLYYMAVTENLPHEMSFALKYMRKCSKRAAIRLWPGPVALYYLGDVTFDDMLVSATGQREFSAALDVSRTKLLSRRRLCVALFHDAVRRRHHGAEELCLARMRECHSLENPLIEREWYLARYEVERIDRA